MLFKFPDPPLSNNFRSGLQQGELTPAEISINGGLPYDNKFLINGMSINNNINPTSSIASNNATELQGDSQTVSVNTDLLCNLKILDSNVSAEYGEFTGGVVSAETCAPTTQVGEIHGSISYDYTSDSWSKINFADQESLDDYEASTSESQQPFFTKQGISATLYGNINEVVGFNAFGSFRHSSIPLKTPLSNPSEFDQKRTASNYGLELFYTPSNTTTLKVGTQLFENTGDFFNGVFLNSNNTHQSNSESFYINLKNKFDFVLLEQQLNYQTQENSREAENNSFIWTKSSTKNWNPTLSTQSEGNFGSLEQQEEKLEYSIKALFEPFQLVNTSHQFKIGGGFGHYEAYWERAETAYNYAISSLPTKPPKDPQNVICTTPDGSQYTACDEGNGTDGQFLKQRTSYLAGKIDIRQDRWHMYIEDLININPFIQTTLGLRADYDSLTKNNNIAPRSSVVIKPFADDRLHITAGWNRYYGLNSFANELQDQKGYLRTVDERTTSNGDWLPKQIDYTINRRSELDSPYADESVFALNGNLWNINAGLKYVQRENKDQLRRMKNTLEGTTTIQAYDNSGVSESDIMTLSLKTIKPFAFKNSLHSLSLNTDITETNRNFDTYDTTSYTGTPKIYYDGKLIDAEDKPSGDFNIPWTVRLDWNIAFVNIPLNINNYFSYRAGNPAMKKINAGKSGSYEENGTSYDTYIPHETKNAFNWDMRTTYVIPSPKDTKTILGLTINNVINRQNESVSSSGIATPEIGRQFIADITFKF